MAQKEVKAIITVASPNSKDKYMNDSRKIISNLRREGCNTVDLRLTNRCKLCWLASLYKQGESFSSEKVKGGIL